MNATKRWFVGYFSFSYGRVSSMRLISRKIRQDKEGEYVIVDGDRIRLNDERLNGESIITHEEQSSQDYTGERKP